jgi:hypothetical protein
VLILNLGIEIKLISVMAFSGHDNLDEVWAEVNNAQFLEKRTYN